MKGGNKTTTTTSAPDAASAAYLQQMRQMAMSAGKGMTGGPPIFTGPIQQTPSELASPFMNPYQDQVVNGVRGEFDAMRGQAMMGADQQATAAGAFGGSRHGIMAGARLGELDRAQGSTIANILNSGYQNAMTSGVDFAKYQQGLQQQQNMEPIWRQQQGLNFMNLGMGPMGMNQTSQAPGPSKLGQAAGGAMTGASIGSVIPGIGTGIGAAIGGGLGLLGFL